jgi:hypothetical protein
VDDVRVLSLNLGRTTGAALRPFRSEAQLRRFVVRHARALLNITILAVEYPIHTDGDARIDALALDAAHRPVIIEFKHVATGSAICQGLYYLDWLTSHRATFAEIVSDRFGTGTAHRLDWSAPRLLCIAEAIGEREEAVGRQVGGNVELIALRRIAGGIVLLQRPSITTRRCL